MLLAPTTPVIPQPAMSLLFCLDAANHNQAFSYFSVHTVGLQMFHAAYFSIRPSLSTSGQVLT